MKKIIFLFITLFLLSGCTINYNLSIKNNKFIEKIEVYGYNISTYERELKSGRFPFRSQYGELTDENIINKNKNFYSLKDITKNNIRGISYSYDFDLSNYNDSNAVRSCYEYFKVLTEGNNITLSTSNSFNCFSISDELEKVTVNITSYYGVVQSNADKVNGKTYTWEITRENASNKPIIFVYDQSKKNITLIDYFTDNFYIVILLGILLFVVGPILLLIKRKNNKVNKI